VRRRVWNVVLGVVAVFVFSLAAVRLFVFQSAEVRDHGMQPRLGAGDGLLLDRTANDYAVGDVVVFYRGELPFVRRVVGIPGDRVAVVDGHVSVNGFPAETEPRGEVRYKDNARPGAPDERTCIRTLESHSLTFYEVCQSEKGPDRRTRDVESRYIGPGHYYLLCDNRFHCSADSRDVGPVAKGAIRGRVTHRMERAADLDPPWTAPIFGLWEEL
jgi:signal peptidase I